MNQEKISSMIKEIRLKNHLTQQEFASIFGVTYQAVSKWENEKNIPDIAILTEICNKYHYNIEDFLNGKMKRNKKFYIYLASISVVCLILISFLLFHKDTFMFKTLSSNASNFDIKGSIAYNKEKTSIYISDITYSGETNLEMFQNIKCTLYETTKEKQIKIEDCSWNDTSFISLNDFLKTINFQIDEYNHTCKYEHEDSLYLEIEAMNQQGNTTYYKVPLRIEDICSNN